METSDATPTLGDVVALAILRAYRGPDAELEAVHSRIGQLQRHAGAAALREMGFPACAAQQVVGAWVVLSANVASRLQDAARRTEGATHA